MIGTTASPSLVDNPDYTSVVNERHHRRPQTYLADARAKGARIVEINPAGDLSPRLAALARLERVRFPSVDMQALPHPDGSFDLLIHSDTLEHVPDPRRGLSECRRVLAPGGWLAMTIPTIPGRLTRDRRGLPASYHGCEARNRDDHLVHTEFGADAWSMLAETGFERIGIRTFAYPCAIAWLARKHP